MLFAPHYAKLFSTLLNYALHQKYMSYPTQQARTSACFAEIHKRHSNIGVVPVQVKIDNSITEGEEKRKIVASSCKDKAPGWVLSRKIHHYCTDASRVTRTLTLVHGLKNVMPRPPKTLWWKRTDPSTHRPLDPYLEWHTLVEVNTGKTVYVT